jgi:hypothetical protein
MHTLTRLEAEGRLDRARLLDESLHALMRDFRASQVGWYADFHEALEPTQAERRARMDLYLALLGSPTPGVMKEGLVGLRAIEADVPGEELARAAAGPLSQKQKNLALQMLGLIERGLKRDPSAEPALLDAAATALAHERPDVQERALKLLERFPDRVPRAALLGAIDVVAATLRPRVETLVGVELPSEATMETTEETPPPALSRRHERLHAVESVDELIELAAMLLEGQGDGGAVEAFLDGVSRLCAERPAGFERRTAGLLKQAGAPLEWGWLSGVGLVRIVVRAWVAETAPGRLKPPVTMLGFLARRALEVAERAAKQRPRPLLALPTERGGSIAPDVLRDREAATSLRNRPDRMDRTQARLRAIAAVERVSFVANVIEWQVSRNYTGRSLILKPMHTPRQLHPIAAEVARVGERPASSVWSDQVTWGAWDALGARWCLTALPHHPEVGFAGAARTIAGFIDASPYQNPQVTLELALDAEVPLRQEAWLAIGASLCAKAPDIRRVGTDAIIASIDDGRFAANEFADAIALLLNAHLVKASRLEGPLREAGRVSQRHAVAVARTGEALVTRLPEAPHGIQAPLEVVLENAARAGVRMERPDAREALERLRAGTSATSKLGRLSTALLDLA